VSPEDRRSLTILEAIDAAGRKPPPPLVIVQEKYMMSDWFSPEMDLETTVITSEKSFTNNQIGFEFLKHFINHTDAGPHSEWKLLLMNNHDSHETPEFLKLANENHILPYPLISHLTHCMQPLDVDVFQSYKHWYEIACCSGFVDSKKDGIENSAILK
jgi:hypothetical protein